MTRKGIEWVSPATVYNRVVLGVVIAFFAYMWSPTTEDGATTRSILIGAGIVLAVWGLISVRNPLLAIQYHSNPEDTVVRLIDKEWKPEPMRLEAEYEKSLKRFLQGKLPFAKITSQYGTGRVKCDLAVDKEVMIELKVGMKSTQKLQRLIGQIELFRREWEKPIIVVLIGETDEDLEHDLRRSIGDKDDVTPVLKEV